MAVFVTDTHPLAWYALGEHHRLPKRVLRLFRQAESDLALVYVPAVALWELSLLVKSGRIRLREPFEQWADMLLAARGFALAPLDPDVIGEAMGLRFNTDPFDAAIVATARIRDLPLITADEEILRSNTIDVVW